MAPPSRPPACWTEIPGIRPRTSPTAPAAARRGDLAGLAPGTGRWCDGTAEGATGTDRPGTGVTPPTAGSWLDRGADGRTWIDTVAIMTKMTAAAEKKNTGSVLPAG